MTGMGTKWLAGTVLGLPLSIALCGTANLLSFGVLWLPRLLHI